MERGWCFQPTDQAAAFVPIWDPLVPGFFWPGLTVSAARCPFPAANGKGELSQLRTRSLAHLFTNVEWEHWNKTKRVKCTQTDKCMLDGINLGELK